MPLNFARFFLAINMAGGNRERCAQYIVFEMEFPFASRDAVHIAKTTACIYTRQLNQFLKSIPNGN